MEEEMDAFLLGDLSDDADFVKMDAEGVTRLVQLRCCGVMLLAGDLDQHITEVCSSREDGHEKIIAPPKCLRCHAVIQPGFYRKQGNLLRKRHQEIKEIHDRMQSVKDDVDADLDELQESCKSLLLRSVFGKSFSDERARWSDVLDEWTNFERSTKPESRRAPKKQRRQQQEMNDRFAKAHAEWRANEDEFCAMRNTIDTELPRAREGRSEGAVVRAIISVLFLLKYSEEVSDESTLNVLRRRLEAVEILAHYDDLRKSFPQGIPPRDTSMFFAEFPAAILNEGDAPDAHCIMDANLHTILFRLEVLRHAATSSATLTETDTIKPQHIPKHAVYRDWEHMIQPLLDEAAMVVKQQKLFTRGTGRGRFFPNPCLRRGCSAFQRFAASSADILHRDLRDVCQIAFHGTSKEAVGPICYRGFDVLRRAVQANGPGEYFGAAPEVSEGYNRNTEQMLLCALLKNRISVPSGGQILVVNNPTNDLDKAYVIPLGVVVYGATAQLHDETSLFSCTYPKSCDLDFVDRQISSIRTIQNQQNRDDSPDARQNILQTLEENVARLENQLGLTRPSREMLQSLTKVLGVTAGHWYKCSRGHLYVIADCGGAMMTSTCPECGESIGGESHRLVTTSRSAASEVADGATAAWPQ
jgi:hypothetical protein